MSKYYDSGPFKISQWNNLIQDVNNILQNPPPGTACQPITTLQTVSDPHKWSVTDVTQVRTALQQTCPSISFTAPLVMWKTGIIDEIESQMGQAWCDCPPIGPEYEDTDLGSHGWELIQASPYNEIIDYGNGYEDAVRCCGNMVKDMPCAICIGLHCGETVYTGEYYPCPEVDSIYPAIGYGVPGCTGAWDTAYQKTLDFINAVNNQVKWAKKIEQNQAELDTVVAHIDALIAQLQGLNCSDPADYPTCVYLKSQLCGYWGPQADPYQAQVDLYVGKFATDDANRIAAQSAADAAAQEAWSLASSIGTRFPCDKNYIHDFTSPVANNPWAKWFNPNWDTTIGDTMAYAMNTWANEVRPCVTATITHEGAGQGITRSPAIRLSPGGFPFAPATHVSTLQFEYGLPYYLKHMRYRCEGVLWVSCNPTPGQCNWYDWSDDQPVYWSKSCEANNCVTACMSFCSWLWAPLPPQDPSDYGTDHATCRITRLSGRKGKDYTQEQTVFWNKYLHWYDSHPKYDDRHNAYC